MRRGAGKLAVDFAPQSSEWPFKNLVGLYDMVSTGLVCSYVVGCAPARANSAMGEANLPIQFVLILTIKTKR